MTDENPTTIERDDRVPLLRITRDFAAPPSLLFAAHADPALVVQWLGPRDLAMTIDHYDCRTGGSYRYTHTRGDFTAVFFGCFHDVRPDARIVQTFTWEGMPDTVALEQLDLIDLGGGRTRLASSSLVDSFEARDAFVSGGMEDGIRESYARLDALL